MCGRPAVLGAPHDVDLLALPQRELRALARPGARGVVPVDVDELVVLVRRRARGPRVPENSHEEAVEVEVRRYVQRLEHVSLSLFPVKQSKILRPGILVT